MFSFSEEEKIEHIYIMGFFFKFKSLGFVSCFQIYLQETVTLRIGGFQSNLEYTGMSLHHVGF